MKIGYIEKPYESEYSRPLEFLTEEEYEAKDRWDAQRYQRIVYQEVD